MTSQALCCNYVWWTRRQKMEIIKKSIQLKALCTSFISATKRVEQRLSCALCNLNCFIWIHQMIWPGASEERTDLCLALSITVDVMPSGPRMRRSRSCRSSAGWKSTASKNGCSVTSCPGSALDWSPSCKVNTSSKVKRHLIDRCHVRKSHPQRRYYY